MTLAPLNPLGDPLGVNDPEGGTVETASESCRIVTGRRHRPETPPPVPLKPILMIY